MTRPGKARKPPVYRCADVLDGRPGFRIEGRWGHVSVLEGGGHICELVSKKHPGINPLWKPHWETIDPYKYAPAKHARVYGRPPDGKLLAGIAGHSLSFDYFGPPSPEETAAGLSTHGEAPALKWNTLQISQASVPVLEYGLELPKAQIRFSRKISVERDHAVVYCEETALNLSTFDRPISWNEHVTFGPPFLECGRTIFDMPATRGKACPASYSAKTPIQPDAEFDWPLAPAKNGGHINLRTTPEARFGHYTAQLLNPELEIAYVAACNPRLGFLVLYVFCRKDFPWVGNWEERLYRTSAPWRGRTFCRGMEFSTTPFAVPRRETVTQGNMFGEPTYVWLAAKAEAKVRFMTLLIDIPKDFKGVASVVVKGGEVRVGETETGHELKVPVKKFL
jgi:hypothetical protein